MKKTIYKLATSVIIIMMIGSCRPPADNTNPSGEGIDQEWKDDKEDEINEENDTIFDRGTKKNSRDEKDRSVNP